VCDFCGVGDCRSVDCGQPSGLHCAEDCSPTPFALVQPSLFSSARCLIPRTTDGMPVTSAPDGQPFAMVMPAFEVGPVKQTGRRMARGTSVARATGAVCLHVGQPEHLLEYFAVSLVVGPAGHLSRTTVGQNGRAFARYAHSFDGQEQRSPASVDVAKVGKHPSLSSPSGGPDSFPRTGRRDDTRRSVSRSGGWRGLPTGVRPARASSGIVWRLARCLRDRPSPRTTTGQRTGALGTERARFCCPVRTAWPCDRPWRSKCRRAPGLRAPARD
jgi:hypothetical protein